MEHFTITATEMMNHKIEEINASAIILPPRQRRRRPPPKMSEFEMNENENKKMFESLKYANFCAAVLHVVF